MVIELGEHLSGVLTDLICMAGWLIAIYMAYKFINNLIKEDD